MLSVASGHLSLLSFYIARCKKYDIYNPYDIDNVVGNYDMYDEKYFENINYLSCKKKIINLERDLLYDFSSFTVFNKTLLKKDNSFIELPQELFLILSIIFSKQKDSTEIKEIYDQISSKKISLSTPIISNLRTTDFKNTASCYIMKLNDKLQNIFSSISNIGYISSLGGGVGVNLSSIRSKGSSVRKRPNTAVGVLNVCKFLDVMSSSISQGGKRSAAITAALDVWHLEIKEFLEINLESGDNRKKCFDIFPQIVINDNFMRRVEQKQDWYLLDPKDIRLNYGEDLSYLISKDFDNLYEKIIFDISQGKKIKHEIVSANEIMKKIIISQIETGLPYLFFKDTVNKNNPNIEDGRILSGNLCQESFTNFGYCNDKKQDLYHTCNLLSLNLSNILNKKELEKSCHIGVNILNSLFKFDNNIKSSMEHNNRYRTIGIGALGLHDHLSFKNMKYGSDKSIKYIKKLFHLIFYFTYRESVNYAKITNSSYLAYNTSSYNKGIINGKTCYELEQESNALNLSVDWKQLFSDMKKYGIYNSHILAIAPNTSTSIIQNATASVLPIYSKFFVDNNSHAYAFILPRYSLTYVENYVQYSEIPMERVVKLISEIQNNIDQGISFELIFDMNKNLKAKYIKDIIFLIWKSNCKTIYYTRTLQKVIDKDICESCTA